MRTMLVVLVLSCWVSAPALAQNPPPPAPLTDEQHHQIVLSLEQLALSKQQLLAEIRRYEAALAPEKQREYESLKILLEITQATQELLCTQNTIPSGQYDCP